MTDGHPAILRGGARIGGVGVAVALLLAGCGGGGSASEADKSPATIAADTRQAAAGAASVHVVGDVKAGGQDIKLDLQLVRGGTARGTVTVGATAIDVIRAGDALYVRTGGTPYEKLSLTDPRARQFTQFTVYSSALDQLLPNDANSRGLTKDGTTSIDGKPTIKLAGIDGALYVANDLRHPYPLRIKGASSGQPVLVTFRDWGAAVAISPPASVVTPAPSAGPSS